MNKIFLKFNSNKLAKLKETSEYLNGLKGYSQSDYWRLHESLSVYKFKSDGVYIQGDSGHYYPQQRTFYNLIKAGLTLRIRALAFKACSEILYLSRISQRSGEIPAIFFPYANAYDVVWSIPPAKYSGRFDFRNIQIPKEFKNHESLLKHWHLKDQFVLNSKFCSDFYQYFVVHHFCQNPDRILEIGGGNGNLASIFHYYSKSHITLVDIPSTLLAAIIFLSYVFPNAKMVFPHELSRDKDLNDYHFRFLLPDQTGRLKNESFDLAINNGSFQEMTSDQICEYFNLIYRVLRNGGIFSTLNRVEKFPSKETKPIRFSEYPYTFPYEVLLYEIDPFMKLVQRDSCIHKIIKIIKQ